MATGQLSGGVGGSPSRGQGHRSPARLPGRAVSGLEAGLQIEKIAARSPWQGSDGMKSIGRLNGQFRFSQAGVNRCHAARRGR